MQLVGIKVTDQQSLACLLETGGKPIGKRRMFDRRARPITMTDDGDHLRRKAISGSKSRPNDRDGGTKGFKGPIRPEDRHNPNAGAES